MALAAARMNCMIASPTLAVRMAAAKLKADGKDIVRVSSGEPDFDTPEHIKDAAVAAIQANATRYTDVSGTPSLRRAVAAKFKRDNGVDYAPGEVLIATGGKQVIFNALIATIDEGDEAIIPAPCWVSYPDMVKLADGVPVIINTEAGHAFKLTPAQREAAITPRTKWFILNNPCNPTGAVYNRDELRALAEVLLRHPQIWVFTDDIYEKLVFDGRVPTTMVQAEPRLRNRTVTMNGCSKSYAMTGWRSGFAGAPRDLIIEMEKLQGQSTSNSSSISQAAAGAALTGPRDGTDAPGFRNPAEHGCSDVEPGCRRPLRHAGRHFLRLPRHTRLPSAHHRCRGEHRNRHGLCRRGPRRNRRGYRPRFRLPGSRSFPPELCGR